jgi:hypothetical protein
VISRFPDAAQDGAWDVARSQGWMQRKSKEDAMGKYKTLAALFEKGLVFRSFQRYDNISVCSTASIVVVFNHSWAWFRVIDRIIWFILAVPLFNFIYVYKMQNFINNAIMWGEITLRRLLWERPLYKIWDCCHERCERGTLSVDVIRSAVRFPEVPVHSGNQNTLKDDLKTIVE